jgi:hypothetical protein
MATHIHERLSRLRDVQRNSKGLEICDLRMTTGGLRAQQLLGRDRRTAVLGIERGELVVEGGQGFVGDATDQTQRVVAGDTALRPHIVRPVDYPNPPMRGRSLPSIRCALESDAADSRQGVFQQTVRGT